MMKHGAKKFFAAILLTSAVLLCGTPAEAKSTKDYSIPYDDLWSTVLRFIRVDLNNQITEHDKEAGYIIFMFRKDDKSAETRATVEFIKRKEEKGESRTTVQLDITHSPTFLEKYFFTGLSKKVRGEFGKE